MQQLTCQLYVWQFQLCQWSCAGAIGSTPMAAVRREETNTAYRRWVFGVNTSSEVVYGGEDMTWRISQQV